MQESNNTILPDHQEKLDAQFDQINDWLHNEDYKSAIEAISSLHYADLADFLDNTNNKLYEIIIPLISEHIHPETIVWLHDSNKQPVIEALGITPSALLISELDAEDAIEVIDQLEDNLKDELLSAIPEKTRQQILEGLTYDEDTVGRVLEKKFIALKRHWTVGQSIDYIRRSNLGQDFHAAVIVDEKFSPVGNILLCTLLQNQRNMSLNDLMNKDCKVACANSKLNELVFIFKQYALTIVPVINKKGKLIGTISIDNMLYIIEEQTESEMMNLGGLSSVDIFDSLYATAKHRFPWLFVNLISACVTSIVIHQFNATIVQLITLAAMMPIVASMGGNAGTQAMTITVRALANREINVSNRMKVIFKETFVCFVNGFILALVGLILTFILFSNTGVSVVFAMAVVINFTAAGLMGSGIPIILHYNDIDPAAASGVFLTAFTDAIGFFSFLSLAFIFLI